MTRMKFAVEEFKLAVDELARHLVVDRSVAESSFIRELDEFDRIRKENQEIRQEAAKDITPIPVEDKIKAVQERLAKDFGDQPAGVPVALCEPGLDIVLAGAYIKHKRNKGKPKKSQKLEELEKEEADSSIKWETLGKEAKLSAIRSFANFFLLEIS